MYLVTLTLPSTGLKSVGEVVSYMRNHVTVEPVGVIANFATQRPRVEPPGGPHFGNHWYQWDITLSEDDFPVFAEYLNRTFDEAVSDWNAAWHSC